jgi:type I restriction enzyme, S subunit
MSERGRPPGWREAQLGSIGACFRGRGGTRADEQAGGLPCIRYGDLYTHHDCIVRSFCSAISPASASAYTALQSGDIVFATSGETPDEIGKATAYCDSGKAYAGADTIIFRPGAELDSRFAGYAVNSVDANRYKAKMGQGSSVFHISSEHLSRLRLRFPSAPNEQQWVADVLQTVDEAIENTEALIAKTQQIKAGLMHDLFNRGIRPDGQLRPPREEAPKLYKESPLGWIAKDWDAQPCSEVTELITVGVVVRPAQYYVIEGVPAFRSANIREDGIDPTGLVYISPQSNRLLAKSQVRTGDVLSVRTGYPGTSAVVPSEYAGANCIDVLISRPCAHLRSAYLAAWINSPFGKEQVLRKQGGLAQQHFNVGELRDLLVALPSAPEQDRIISRFQSIDDKLAAERALAQKYGALKRGLMHDLLIGRVRVPVAEAQKAAANV